MSGTDVARLAQLRQTLVEQFSEQELRDLCFDMRVDYESLGSGGKADRARELVAYCVRHERIAELEAQCRQRHMLPRSIHDNLPHQPYFFGREDELRRIADALDPEAVGWGVLIDGAGGIGKTALAIRAGHLALDDVFPIKIFLSAKTRELTSRGEQKLEDFQLPNYMALLAELARELGEDEIAKMNPDERANELRRALADRHALVIIDNLETLEEPERERLFQFLRRLPHSCKAMVTSRRRTDVAAEIIRLDRLTLEAARQLIAKIAERNPMLMRASEAERQQLYETAGGNPLLIEWLVGQLGREGSRCHTIADACAFMQSAPPGNDPLEYIFGDLLDTFTESETAVLAALSHFTLPAKTKWIAEMTELSEVVAQTALEDLTDRALVVADTQFQTFLLPRLAATFLRRKQPAVITTTGIRLTEHVFAFVQENGYEHYERFPTLNTEWSAIVAALPLFLGGDNDRLQTLCYALNDFLNFSGRRDDRLNLNLQAEERAKDANDLDHAGWAAYNAGRVYYLRDQAVEVLACADRAEAYWSSSGAHHRAYAMRLRGLGHRLERNYPAAITAFQEALGMWRTIGPENERVVQGLDSLAQVERLSGDLASADRDYHEALQIAQKVNYRDGVVYITGHLAELELDYQDWPAAERFAQEALGLAETLRKQESIADNCRRLAKALVRRGRSGEGVSYAVRAVELYAGLRSPRLAEAQAVLKECEEAALSPGPSP